MEEGEKASPKANGICKPWALTEFLKNVAERGHCFGLPGIGAADIPFENYGMDWLTGPGGGLHSQLRFLYEAPFRL